MVFDHAQSSLELLYNISRQLVSSLELQTVLENVVNLSIHYLGAERGNLIVLDGQQRPSEAVMVYNNQRLPYTVEQLRQVVDQGLAGWVLRTRQTVLIADTSQDERWVRRPDDEANRSGAKSAICVPLQTRSQLVGVLTLVHPEPGFFTQAHLDLLQSIGDQAGIAIYNARLYNSLQVATQRYHELFENSIDPDFDHRLVRQDLGSQPPGRTDGRTGSAYAGGQIDPRLARSRTWKNWASILNNLSSGEMVTYESVFHSPKGELVPVEIYVYRVRLPEGEVIQWTMRDITARKELDMLRNDLAAMVYHDLRSPLSNIISSLDMMEGLLPKDEVTSLRTIFGIASRSTERMQRLISSLLDINRLEAGQPITNQKSVAVANLLREAADAIQPSVEGKHQQLEVVVPESAPDLWVDEDMIRRVLINLVENATKFTPMKGQIRVSAEIDWETACVSACKTAAWASHPRRAI